MRPASSRITVSWVSLEMWVPSLRVCSHRWTTTALKGKSGCAEIRFAAGPKLGKPVVRRNLSLGCWLGDCALAAGIVNKAAKKRNTTVRFMGPPVSILERAVAIDLRSRPIDRRNVTYPRALTGLG